MKSAEYWTSRMDALNEAMLAKGEAFIRTQNDEYEKAMARIRKETEAWYARLAKNSAVSLAEARKLLDSNELREFKWTVEDYIKAGRENAVDQRWAKQLENASAKVHITRLQELEFKLQQEVELLAAKRIKGTTDVLGDIYKDSYYRSVYELQKGVGVGASFAALDDRQIDKVLARPWAPDGRNFSARIWADRTKLVNELQTLLTQDLIRGEPAGKAIADFADRMNVSMHAAARLVRTEAAYFSGQSRLDGYRETGVEQYQIVATLDRRTSDICRSMDGRVFRVSEAKVGVNYPPLHVYCRSTTAPYFEDAETGERATRGDDGKTYSVPGDMTYKEWEEKHAPRDASKEPRTTTPRPTTAPPVRSADDERNTGDDGRRRYAPEPEKWYDEAGEAAPKLLPPKDLPLDDLEPDKPRKLGDIDPAKRPKVEEYLEDAENTIRNRPEEHAVVITKDGEVWHVRGDGEEVRPGVIGEDKLKDAIITHNHPDFDGDPGGSFSGADVVAFIFYGLQELRAVDSEYTYRLTRSGDLKETIDQIRELLLKAEEQANRKVTIEELLSGYDVKHLTMVELVELLRTLIYERR